MDAFFGNNPAEERPVRTLLCRGGLPWRGDAAADPAVDGVADGAPCCCERGGPWWEGGTVVAACNDGTGVWLCHEGKPGE